MIEGEESFEEESRDCRVALETRYYYACHH
jgi:hypothetical protein